MARQSQRFNNNNNRLIIIIIIIIIISYTVTVCDVLLLYTMCICYISMEITYLLPFTHRHTDKHTDEFSIMYKMTTSSVIHYYLSHCYTIAWDRLSNQFFLSVYVCVYVCMYVCMCVCVCGHAYGRIFQPIFTKFGKNLWGLNRKN